VAVTAAVVFSSGVRAAMGVAAAAQGEGCATCSSLQQGGTEHRRVSLVVALGTQTQGADPGSTHPHPLTLAVPAGSAAAELR
jgi:hypothetical protein